MLRPGFGCLIPLFLKCETHKPLVSRLFWLLSVINHLTFCKLQFGLNDAGAQIKLRKKFESHYCSTTLTFRINNTSLPRTLTFRLVSPPHVSLYYSFFPLFFFIHNLQQEIAGNQGIPPLEIYPRQPPISSKIPDHYSESTNK